MVNSILNAVFLRHLRTEFLKGKFVNMLQTEGVEGFIEILLKLMSLMFCIDKDFRRNIKDFNARYLFRDRSGLLTVSAVFENDMLKVSNSPIDNTDVTITFKDQCALYNFIISPKPDIINALLNQDVTFKGNMNYITKFVYMVTHLRVEFLGYREAAISKEADGRSECSVRASTNI